MIRGASGAKPAALVLRSGGEWAPDVPYEGGTVVRHGGASYLTAERSQGEEPGKAGTWQLLARDAGAGGGTMAITRTDAAAQQAQRFAQNFAGSEVAARSFIAGHDAAKAELQAANQQVVRMYAERESTLIEQRMEWQQAGAQQEKAMLEQTTLIALLEEELAKAQNATTKALADAKGEAWRKANAESASLKQQIGELRRAEAIVQESLAKQAERIEALHRERAALQGEVAAMQHEIDEHRRTAQEASQHAQAPGWWQRTSAWSIARWQRFWSVLTTPIPR